LIISLFSFFCVFSKAIYSSSMTIKCNVSLCSIVMGGENSNESFSQLGKPRILILSTRNVIWTFGGGRFAAVTFLCETSWKNSIVFLKALTFRNHLSEYKKENNLIQPPVYTIVIPYLFYTEIFSHSERSCF
jgi:hypothetical protein